MAKTHDTEKSPEITFGAGDEPGVGYTQASIDETSTDEELLAYTIDPVEERRLLRRLDSFIAPMVSILYLISFLDRSNIGSASTGGMLEDLNSPLNGLSVATSVFYATYVTFEPFWTTIVKVVRPQRLLPVVTIVWGGVVLANGFIQNYGSLIGLRLGLGLLESALTPCLFLYLTFCYLRNELALRTSYLFVSAAIAGVVGGLIAAGFLKMDGVAGLEGWRWLYIIEGAITIAIGIISYFFIANSPQTAWYLSPRQRLLTRVRTVQSRQYNGEDVFSWVEVRKAFTEPLILVSGLMQLGFDVTLYGASTFFVVIVRGFGYSTINSQLLTAPIYAWAAIVYMCCAYIADRTNNIRFWLILSTALVTCVGYIILLAVKESTGAKLFACFLVATGVYTSVGLNVSWNSANIAGVRKRSTGIGVQQTIGNCGGIIAGQIYRKVDSPLYRLGHAVSLSSMAWGIGWMLVYLFIVKRRNAAKLAMTEEEKEQQDRDGVTGDRHWSFKYVF